ncbi:MAG: hypothetical protein FK733_19630 [Asgard group archaeon]|nr:hypothetical protein [Asgard group archaeon]
MSGSTKYKIIMGLISLLLLGSGFFVLLKADNIQITEEINYHTEDANLTQLSHWDGLYGATTCMVYKDNYAFIGGMWEVGVIVVSVPFFSIPTPVANYQFPEGEETVINDIAISADDNYLFLATDSEGLVVLHFDNVTETISRVGEYQIYSFINNVLVDGDICYCVKQSNALITLNISDPSSPVLLDEYNPGHFTSNFCKENDLVYLACHSNGIDIINVSDPSSLSLDSQLPLVESFQINVKNSIAFISTSMSIHELAIYNLTDNSYLANYTTIYGPNAVLIEDDIAYIPEVEVVELVDISDLSNPIQMSYLNVTLPGYVSEVHVDRNFLFYTDQENGLEIYDCFDPYNIVKAGVLPLSGYVHNIYITGTTAYAYAANFTTVVLNIADPANPIPIDYYEGDVVNINKIEQHKNHLFFMDLRGHVEIAEPGPPVNHVITYDANSHARDMCFDGDLLYITTENGFEVVDISDVNNPTRITEYTGASNLRDVAVYNNQTLYACDDDTIYIFDINDLGAITQLSATTQPDYIRDMTWVYNQLAVITYDNNLRIIDVSNPSSPSELGSSNIGAVAEQVFVRNNIAFVFYDILNLVILNLTNPSDITTIDTFNHPSFNIYSIFVTEDYIALALLESGMELYSYDIAEIPITTPPDTTTPTGGNQGNPNTFLWIGVGTAGGVLFVIIPVVIVMSRRSILAKRERLKREAVSVFYSCRHCGIPINKDAIVCDDCGKDILRCVICKLPVSFGEKIGQCSLCQAQGHLEHMQDWVSEKNKCPYCLQEIPVESIIPVIADEEEKKNKKEE